MTYSTLEAALTAAGWAVYKDAAPSGKAEYIVLSTYNIGLRYGDDAAVLRWSRCQLDCYSQSAGADDLNEGAFVSILDTLSELDIPYHVESCDYDHDAAAMRLIIQFDAL